MKSTTQKALKVFSTVLVSACVVSAIYYLFNLRVAGFVFSEIGYLFLILALLLPLVYLYYPASPRFRGQVPWFDVVLMALTFIIPLYFFLNSSAILDDLWEQKMPALALPMAVILILAVLEGTRRSVGWLFLSIIIVFLIYPFVGSHLPGFLEAPPFSFQRVIGFLTMSPAAIPGVALQTVGKVLIGFILFGIAFQSVGGGEFLMKLALMLVGKAKGGIPKISILASALFGTISGSIVSNVVTVGSFTIPAMVKQGYPPYLAAAIEACASTGGAIMPPIMGASAFLMATLLGIPYWTVALAAVVPGTLYFVSLFLYVDATARSGKVQLTISEQRPQVLKTVLGGWQFIVAAAVLVWALFFLRRDAQAPFLAIAALLVLTLPAKGFRFSLRVFRDFTENGGKTLGQLAAILCTVGILIGSFFLTGLGNYMETIFEQLFGHSLVPLALSALVFALVLGTGIPPLAAYALMAALMGPALVALGFPRIAAHMFMIYATTLASITPPEAIAPYTAAAVAGAPPMKTAFWACRVGSVLFFMPLVLLFRPAIVLVRQPFAAAASSVLFASLFTVLMVSAMSGYLWRVGVLGTAGRIVIGASAILMIIDSDVTEIAALALIVAYIAWRLIRRTGKRPAAKA